MEAQVRGLSFYMIRYTQNMRQRYERNQYELKRITSRSDEYTRRQKWFSESPMVIQRDIYIRTSKGMPGEERMVLAREVGS
jgi:hypothetical protein